MGLADRPRVYLLLTLSLVLEVWIIKTFPLLTGLRLGSFGCQIVSCCQLALGFAILFISDA